jgi:hypothetical protein
VRVLISIVVYGSSHEELSGAIASIEYEKLAVKVSIVIVDNFGCVGIKKLCQDNKWQYCCPRSNLGFGGGHNLATRVCKEDYEIHLILNPDIILSAKTVNSCIDFMSKNKQIALLSPKLFNEDGSTQNICRLLPSLGGLLMRVGGYFSGFAHNKLESSLDLSKGPITVPAIHGACYFVRKSSFFSVGGFDEDYFLYVEDIDLCRRLSSTGEIVYFPEVGAIHAHGKGSYKNIRLTFYHLRSFFIYFQKWGLFFDPTRNKLNNPAGLSFQVSE